MEKTSLVRFANADDTSTSTEARSIPTQGVCDIASTCASRQKANYRNNAVTDPNSLSLVVKSPWPHRTAHLSATPTQRLSDIVTVACDQLGIPFGPSPEAEVSVYGPDLRELPLDSNLEAALVSCTSGMIGSSGAIISIDSRSSKNKPSSGTFAGGDGIDAPSLKSLTGENGQLCLYLLPYKVLWEQYWQGTGGALHTTRTTNAQASDKSLAGDATLSVSPASTAPPSRSASETQMSTPATPSHALTGASPACSGALLGPQEEPEWLPLYWHLWMSDPDHTVGMLAAPPDGCPPVSFVHDADTPLSVSLDVFATWMGIPSLEHLSRRFQEPAVTQATELEHPSEVSEPLSDANRLAVHTAECANGNGSNGAVKDKAAAGDAGYGEGRTQSAPLDSERETQQLFADDALEPQPAAAAHLPRPEAPQKTESSNLEHQPSAQSQQLQRDPLYQQHEHLQNLQQQSCDVPASTQASGCGSWCREWLRGGGTRMLRLLAATTTTSSVASSVSDVGSGNGSIAAGGVGSERSVRGSGSGSGSESGCKPASGTTGPASATSGAGGGQTSDVAHCGGAGRCCANGGARSAMGRVCHGSGQDLDSGGPGGDAGMGSELTVVVTSAAGCCGSSTSATTATFPALHLLWLNRQVSYDASPADLGMCDQSVVALLNLCDRTDCAACLMTRGSLCGNLELIEAALVAGGLGPVDEQQQLPGLAVSRSCCAGNAGTVTEAAGGPGEGGGGNAVDGEGGAAIVGAPRVECGAPNGCRPPMLMPLGMAAANGHEAALELLLKRKVDDPNVCDKFGLPALWFAVEHGQPGCVRLLLHSGARAADWVFAAPAVAAAGAQLAPAAAAAERAAAERATAAAAAGLPVAVASYMGLCHAVEVGNVQTVRELLRFGACPYTPDDSNGTPYHMAIERGDLEIVEALLDGDPAFEELQRAQADSYRRLLHASQRVERSEVAGCPCVQCNYRVAIRAAASPETEELRAQLQLVALPTIMDAAPPEAAVSLMALMKQRGALLDAHDADGYTALHLAVRAGNLAAIRWLLQNGADPLERDALGYMPLHLLAHYGCSAAPPPAPQSPLPAAVGANPGAQVTASGKSGTATASPDASDAAVMAASGGQLELAAARLLVEDVRMPLGAKTTCFAYEADVRTEEKKLRSAPVGGVSSGSAALTRGGRRGGGSSATAKKRSRDPMLTVPLYGGHTAAQLALRYGRPLLLAYLLHRGAPLDLSSATSRHCLEKALEAGHSAAARILLSYVQQGKTSSANINGSATSGTSSSATALESKKANARVSKRSGGGGSTATSAAGGSGGGKESPLDGDRWQKTAAATESTPSGAAVAVAAAAASTANGMSQVQVQAGGPMGRSPVTSAEPDRATDASGEESVTASSAEAVSGTTLGGGGDGASALLLERRKARRTGAGFAISGTVKYGNEGGSGVSASSVAEDPVGRSVSIAAALPAQEGSTQMVVPSASAIHSAPERCTGTAQSSTADSMTPSLQVSASPIAKASSATPKAASFSPAAPVAVAPAATGTPAAVPATDQSGAAASTGALTRDVTRAASPRATVTVAAAGKVAEETCVTTTTSTNSTTTSTNNSTNNSSGNSSNRMSGAVCSGGEGSGDGGTATDNTNGSKSSRAARRRAARREARMAAATYAAGAVTGTAAASLAAAATAATAAPTTATSSGAPGSSNAPNETNVGVVEASAGSTATADESSARGRTVNDGTLVSGGVVAAERRTLSSPSPAPVAAAVAVATGVNNPDFLVRRNEPQISQKSDDKSSATAVAVPSVPVVPTSRSTDVPETLVWPMLTTNDNANMAGKEQPASDAPLVHVPVTEQKSSPPRTFDEVSRGSLQPSGALLSGAATPPGKLSYCAVSAGISGLGTPVKVESGELFSGIAWPATDEGGEWQVVTGHRHRRGPMGPPTVASEQAAIPPPPPAPHGTLSAVVHSACPAQQQHVNVRQVVRVSSGHTSPQRVPVMVGGDSSPRPGPIVKNSASPSSSSSPSPSSSRAVTTTISAVPTAVTTAAVAVPFSISATSNSTAVVASSASSTTGPSVLSTYPSPLPHSLRGSAMRRVSSSSSATGGGNGAAAGATGSGGSDVCGYIEVPRSLLYGKRGPASQSPTASTSAPAWTTSSVVPSPTVTGMAAAAAAPASVTASPQPSVKPVVVPSSTVTVSPVKPTAVAMAAAPAPSMATGPVAASAAPSFAAAVKGEACSCPPSLTPTPPHSVNAAASGLGPISKGAIAVPAPPPLATALPMTAAAAAPGRSIDTASLRLARSGNKPAAITGLCKASPAGAVGLLSSAAESPCARRASSAGSVGTTGGKASMTTPQPPLSASKLNPKAHEFVPVRVTLSYNSTSASSATKPTPGPAGSGGITPVHLGVPGVQISTATRTDDGAACRTFAVTSHVGPIAKAAMRTATAAPPPPPRTTAPAGVPASLLSPSPAPPPSWMPPTDPGYPRGAEHGAHVYGATMYGTPGIGSAATPLPPVGGSPLSSCLHPSLQVSASTHHQHHQPPASPVAQVMSWQAVQPIQVLSSPIRRLPDLPDLYRAMVSPYCSYMAPSPRNASSAGAAAAAAAAAAASAAVSASAAAVAAANAQAAAAEAHAAATHHHHHQQQQQHLDSESTFTAAAAAASSTGFSSGSATGSSGAASPDQHRSRLHDLTAPPYNPLAAPLPQLSMLPHGLYCGEHLIRPTSTRLWGLDPLQQLRATQTSLDATIAAAFGVPGYLTVTSSAPPMVDGGGGGGGGGGGFTGGLVPGGGGEGEGAAVHGTMIYTMSGASMVAAAAEGRFTGSGDDDVASDVGRVTGDGTAHHERLSGRSSGGGTGSGGVCSGIVRSLHSIFAEELDEQRLVRQHEAAPAPPAPPSVGLSGMPYPPTAGTRCSRGPSPPLPPEPAHPHKDEPRYIAVHPPQPPVRMLPPMPYLHHQMHPRPPMLDESVWPPLRGGLPPALPHGMMLPYGNDWCNAAIALFSGACTATTPGAAQPAVAAAALWWTAVRQAPEPQQPCTDDPSIVPLAGGGSGRASRANSCSDLPPPPPLSQHPLQHTSQSGAVRHGPGRCAIMGRGLRQCGSSDGSSGGGGGGGRGPHNRLMMTQKVQLMGPLDTESMIAACIQGRLGPHTEVCGTVAGVVGPPPLELFEPLGALLGALQGGCGRYMLVERW